MTSPRTTFLTAVLVAALVTGFSAPASALGVTGLLDALQAELQARTDALTGELTPEQLKDKKLWDSALKKLAKPVDSLAKEVALAKKVMVPLAKKKPDDTTLGTLIDTALLDLTRLVTDDADVVWTASRRVFQDPRTAKIATKLTKALTLLDDSMVPASGIPKRAALLKKGSGSVTKTAKQLTKLTGKKGTSSLLNLRVSVGAISPAFHRDVTNYTAGVSLAATTMRFTPTASDPDCTITVAGMATPSGQPSPDIPLIGGSDTTVDVVVTAQKGGNQTTYRVVVSSVDTIALHGYLKASNPGRDDRFGARVAADGDTVVVTAPREQGLSQGINGHQDNNLGMGAVDPGGAVYVFRRGDDGWAQDAYIKSSNFDPGDSFGASMAFEADTIVVGAPGEDSASDQTPGSNSSTDSGAAYIFARIGDEWAEQAYLKSPESVVDGGDRFGRFVTVSGDRAVIGTLQKFFVFERVGTTWTFTSEVIDPGPDIPLAEAGINVAFSGDTFVIGRPLEQSSAIGIDGDDTDTSLTQAGAAYVFVRAPNGTWSRQAYVKASNTESSDKFGTDVDLDSDTLVVGAPGEASSSVGSSGDERNNDAPGSGAVYAFVRNGSTWSQQRYIKASNTNANDAYGQAVCLDGNFLMVGAWAEDGGAAGVNGSQGDNSATNAGAAYLLRRGGTNWIPEQYFKASPLHANDAFGLAVGIGGGTIVVGTRLETSNAAGVNGDGEPAFYRADSGAAYLFEMD